MEKKTVFTILVVVGVLIVAAIAGGIFYSVVLPKLTDDDDDDDTGGNNTNGGGGGGGTNPVPRILVLDETLNTSASREFSIGELVYFDARGSEGNISQYSWQFGDGTSREGPGEKYALVNHTYNSKGTYIINLTVVASNGARGKANVTISIMGEPFTSTQSEILSTRVGSTNATVTFPVEEDARNMTLEFSVNGLSQDVSAILNIGIYNPYHELLDNTTLTFVLADSKDFYFTPGDIAVTGNYFIELNCESGTVRVIVDIYVSY